MENGEIRDDQISASSEFHSTLRAANGRLNHIESIDSLGAWGSKKNNPSQWLQIDFQRSTIITGISTQGRPSLQYVQYVKSYRISSGDEESNFHSYKTGGILRVRYI